MLGTIKRLVRDRGFGFILSGSGKEEKEYFFHRSEVRGGSYDDLREGDPADFEVEESSKGPRACNVRRAR